jgi:hypothetical protein
VSTGQDSVSLEERKFALDAEIRRREVELKEAENKPTGLTAAKATVAGARSEREESNFRHDCETGLGSAGAIVVAVSDNALLGVHYQRSDTGEGVAAQVSVPIAKWVASAILAPIPETFETPAQKSE